MYFQNIPNAEYNFMWENTEGSSGGFVPDVLMKDIFRRVVFTENTKKDFSSFETYIVSDGQKPEEVAADFYGNPHLWWVVLLCNNIIDYVGEWSKSNQEIDSSPFSLICGTQIIEFKLPKEIYPFYPKKINKKVEEET